MAQNIKKEFLKAIENGDLVECSVCGEYIGDENDIEEVIDRIVDSLDIEVIKNE